jgi:hypothetical protein
MRLPGHSKKADDAIDTRTPPAGASRRPYRSPRLVEFGKVRDLTASGTGTNSEFGFPNTRRHP